MNAKHRLTKAQTSVLFGLVAVVLASAVVVAAIILSANVEREQQVFKAIELVVSPAEFPSVTIGVLPTTVQPATATINNPVGNPAVNVTLVVYLVSDGCIIGANVSIETTNLCVGPWTSESRPLNPGAGTIYDVLITYANSFVGTATFTFQAEGTT